MRFFFDTEFIEDGRTIELLSIGIVDEGGRGFYAEVAETDRSRAGPWVRENVLPKLTGPVVPRLELRKAIVDFVGDQPEFWAYYAAHDWVALCQLFGTMMDLPSHWPAHCMDVKQLHVELGRPQLPEYNHTNEHNAISDARWTRAAWGHLDRRRRATALATVDNVSFGAALAAINEIDRERGLL